MANKKKKVEFTLHAEDKLKRLMNYESERGIMVVTYIRAKGGDMNEDQV